MSNTLPIHQHTARIAEALHSHSVIVVAGETGSGKSTQLPQLCLQLGRGQNGQWIGHTQPRRLAARNVALRVAEELQTQIGERVGFKVRFQDQVSESTQIKVMTDGILLNEIQRDPLLKRYDTLIIDEAHERTLNIDFILGYLKRLLQKRRDLKVIITSATLDHQRFAEHFGNVPVIEVSGRGYPIAIEYAPLLDEATGEVQELSSAIAHAVDRLSHHGRGDILVFLPTERDIHEVREDLEGRHWDHTEIVPLYSRLSTAAQQQVFHPKGKRRVILATNVAETSVTVPRVHYVIDAGLARISRYHYRNKVQRLPIEPVSQASANQRAGRCGRIAPGICIRLYSKEDFQSRPEYTEPEILRTNLASVILQMAFLRLGPIEEFPFLNPPDSRWIQDGYRLLQEVGAFDAHGELTEIGRQMVRFPVDPRFARMVVNAVRYGQLRETLIIVAFLSVQDPRERPLERQAAADQAHARYRHGQSDFISILKLWDTLISAPEAASQSKLRNFCQKQFLSYLRVREWRDVVEQLWQLTETMGTERPLHPRSGRGQAPYPSSSREEGKGSELKLRNGYRTAPPPLALLLEGGGGKGSEDFKLFEGDDPYQAHYEQIHRNLLTGLLSHIGVSHEEGGIMGTRQQRWQVFPGSGLFKKAVQWVVAAELIETQQCYGRCVAKIQPEWIEPLAKHLTRRNYFEPHWEKERQQVVAFERVLLYGLEIVAKRKVNYGPIDPELSRELFIREALVNGELRQKADFLEHNQQLLAEIEALEDRARQRNIVIDEAALFAFYAERLPEGIFDGPTFKQWHQTVTAETELQLWFDKATVMKRDADEVTIDAFPNEWQLMTPALPLSYHFDPSADDDGVTLSVPLALLPQVTEEACEWLVPGLLLEKVTELIRALPKNTRRLCQPIPEFAKACLDKLQAVSRRESLVFSLAKALSQMTGVTVPQDSWAGIELDAHLFMNIRLLDAEGEILAESRDLQALKDEWLHHSVAHVAKAVSSPWQQKGLTRWQWGDLPDTVPGNYGGVTMALFPALIDQGDSVDLDLLADSQQALQLSRLGVLRLLALQCTPALTTLKQALAKKPQVLLALGAAPFTSQSPERTKETLREDWLMASLQRALWPEGEPIRTEAAFKQCLDRKAQLVPVGLALLAQWETTSATLRVVTKALASGTLPRDYPRAVADIHKQLQHLWQPGFLTNTPKLWFDRFGVYCKAIEHRLVKLREAPLKDQALQQQWEGVYQRYQRWQGLVSPSQAEEGRWLLEELRISLFAQQFKTCVPVSEKRLLAMFVG